MLFPLADALHINPNAQLTSYVANQSPDYDAYFLIGFLGFTFVSWVIVEAFIIRVEGDVFLLDSGIDVNVPVVRVFTIDADALL